MMALHGFTDEVEEEFMRALELFEGERDVPQLFPVLRALSGMHGYRGESDKAAHYGRQILDLADAQSDPRMAVDGHLMVGTGLTFMNDVEGGLEALAKGIEAFESQPRGSHRFQLGANPGIACYTTAALTLWLRGFPDRGLEHAQRAVTLAMELRHPFTMAYALFHNSLVRLFRQEPEPMRDRAVGAVDVADEYDLPIWRAVGTVLLGAARTDMGHFDEGLAQIDDGVAQYQGLRSPPVFWPILLYVRARACARAGRPAEGLELIEQSLAITGEVGTLPPLFLAMKGELLLALPDADAGAAAASFQQGYDVAADLGVRSLQLRAAIGLTRAQPEHGRELLRATHATFTEGFATRDLIEATALLEAPAA